VIKKFQNKYQIPIELKRALSGVKGTIVPNGNQDLVDFISRNPYDAGSQMFISFFSYLKEDLKMSFVAWSPDQKVQISSQYLNPCDIVEAYFEYGSFESTFLAVGKIPSKVGFKFCDGQTYIIETELGINGNTNYSKKVKKHFSKILSNNWKYDSTYRKQLKEVELAYSLNKVDSLLNAPTIEGIIGTYSIFTKLENWTIEDILIIKNSDKYDIVYLKGKNIDWRKGELKGTLTPTLSDGHFLVKYFGDDKTEYSGSAIFENNALEFTIEESKAKFVKIK
jgi:hypothetical protein